MLNAVTILRLRTDETEKEVINQQLSYAEAKKKKSLALRPHGYIRASLRKTDLLTLPCRITINKLFPK